MPSYFSNTSYKLLSYNHIWDSVISCGRAQLKYTLFMYYFHFMITSHWNSAFGCVWSFNATGQTFTTGLSFYWTSFGSVRQHIEHWPYHCQQKWFSILFICFFTFIFTQIHFVNPVSVKRSVDMKHVKIRIIYTALDNTRYTALYQNWLSTII